jgi:general secretion pathway protein D
LLNSCATTTSSVEGKSLSQHSTHTKKNTEKYYNERYDVEIVDTSTQALTSKHKKRLTYLPGQSMHMEENIRLEGINKKHKNILIDDGEKVQLSVENIPIGTFIDLVFGKILKKNYTVSDKVRKLKDHITLNMSEKESKQDFYEIVKKLLSMHNIYIKNEKGMFFISKRKGKMKNKYIKNMYVGFGRKFNLDHLNETEEIAYFIPLNYISPSNFRSILGTMGIKPKKFWFKSDSETVLVAGRVEQIKRILELLPFLDRPTLRNKRMVLLHLDFIDTERFVKRLTVLLKDNGIPKANSLNDRGILLEPIPEINSVLVVSPKEEWIELVKFWADMLDIEDEEGGEPRLYIYHVKSRKADELADALNKMLGTTILTKNTQTKVDGKKVKNKKSTLNYVSREKGDYTPTISADLPTNILVMKLTPEHYKILKPIIEKLDRLPLQVLIEVTIAEVTMIDQFQFGFEWYLANSDRSIIASTLDGLGLGSSGLTGVIIKDSGAIQAKINAAASSKKLNIVSEPRMVVLNNMTGHINVGTQVPVITSESTTSDLANPGGTPSILRNVEYRKTGVIVGVTPTINSQGVLTLILDISLSEAQTNDTSNIDSPLIVERSLTTSVVLRSGETILLGGLISSNTGNTTNGVPVLKDIPYFGRLFKVDSDSNTKTELIMLITPTIINAPGDMGRETRRFQALLKHVTILQ